MSLGKTHTDKTDDFSYPDDIKVSWMPKSKGVLTWPVSETRFQMNGPRKKKDTSLRFTVLKMLAIIAGIFQIFHLLPRRLNNVCATKRL